MEGIFSYRFCSSLEASKPSAPTCTLQAATLSKRHCWRHPAGCPASPASHQPGTASLAVARPQCRQHPLAVVRLTGIRCPPLHGPAEAPLSGTRRSGLGRCTGARLRLAHVSELTGHCSQGRSEGSGLRDKHQPPRKSPGLSAWTGPGHGVEAETILHFPGELPALA